MRVRLQSGTRHFLKSAEDPRAIELDDAEAENVDDAADPPTAGLCGEPAPPVPAPPPPVAVVAAVFVVAGAVAVDEPAPAPSSATLASGTRPPPTAAAGEADGGSTCDEDDPATATVVAGVLAVEGPTCPDDGDDVGTCSTAPKTDARGPCKNSSLPTE